MKQYIGTKLVQAEPALRIASEGHKPWYWPEAQGEMPKLGLGEVAEEGYKVRYCDGYESWSPKEVFEEAYREASGMNFGLALEAAKDGFRIARMGWNGKGMYVFLAHGPDFNTDADISEFEDADVECGDCLCIRTAQRTLQMGWLASQEDLLSDDWYIVDDLSEVMP